MIRVLPGKVIEESGNTDMENIPWSPWARVPSQKKTLHPPDEDTKPDPCPAPDCKDGGLFIQTQLWIPDEGMVAKAYRTFCNKCSYEKIERYETSVRVAE